MWGARRKVELKKRRRNRHLALSVVEKEHEAKIPTTYNGNTSVMYRCCTTAFKTLIRQSLIIMLLLYCWGTAYFSRLVSDKYLDVKVSLVTISLRVSTGMSTTYELLRYMILVALSTLPKSVCQ